METETKFNRIVLALASSSLEELPSCPSGHEQETDFYEDYHAAWTALWSPNILATCGFVPETRRSDSSGLDLEGALIVVPEIAKGNMDQPLEERLLLAGNELFFSGFQSRQELSRSVYQKIAPCGEEPNFKELSQEAQNLQQDFFTFGYALMQVQQMARKLRYSFNLDWMVVSDQLIQAARKFTQKDYLESERWLSAAYDSLSQERDRYCSQQGHFIDLVLSAPSTIGRRFSNQMQRSDVPTSLMATYETIEKLKESNPEGFDKMIDRIDQKSLTIVGGFSHEVIHTYLSEQSLHRSFIRAKKASSGLGLPYTKVVAPFHSGIAAHLPTMAKLHAAEGLVIEKFLDGIIPQKEHAKLKWQATSEGPAIDLILGHMVDAANPQMLLEIGASMASQLDYHQVPTLVIAHWPDRVSPVYEDLVRTMRRSPALGRWILADDYFQTTSQPYWSEQFGVEQFPFATPQDAQEIHATQLSLVQLHRNLYGFERLAETLLCWGLADKKKTPKPSVGNQLLGEIYRMLDQVDELADPSKQWLLKPESWSESLKSKLQAIQDQCAMAIQSKLGPCSDWTAIHPASHPRRVSLVLPTTQVKKDQLGQDRVIAADPLHEDPGKTHWIVDLPPYGFTRVPGQSPKAGSPKGSNITTKPKSPSLLSRLLRQRDTIGQPDGSLANEHMEIQVDPRKGHLRSVHIRDQRGNQLSGMVCLVRGPVGLQTLRNQESFIGLSRIHVQVCDISDSHATCTTKGVFEDPVSPEHPSPWIEQTVRMQRGCKWVEVSLKGGGFDRKSTTPIWRTAWHSESATLHGWSHGNRTKWLGPLQANIELIEIDDALHKIYIATGGLSFHVKLGANQLHTLLPVDSQGALEARLILGIDWQRPWENAIDLFQPLWLIPPSHGVRGIGQDDTPVTPQSGGTPQSGWRSATTPTFDSASCQPIPNLLLAKPTAMDKRPSCQMP